MLGIDLKSAADQAVPTIIEQIDNALSDVEINDDESKALVIVSDNKGSYMIVKTVFDSDAHNHMRSKGHEKVDNLIKNVLNSIL